MQQFRVNNPLADLAGVQQTFQRGQAIQGQRQQNQLQQLLAPMRVQSMEQQIDQRAAQMGDDELARNVEMLATLGSAIGDDFESLEPELQLQRYRGGVQAVGQAGFDIDDAPEALTPEMLNVIRQAQSQYASQNRDRVGAQEILPDGTVIQSTSNGVRVMSADGRELTGQDAAAAIRAGREYGIEVERDTYNNRRGGTLDADIEKGGAAESAKEGGKGAAKTQRLLIDDGLDAVGEISNLQRTLELLDEVSTGGMQTKAALSLKQTFGIEGADEGELSARLGKAVLGQLKATFGSQFTEREGARLERIEANFGKNTETNKRLIRDALNSVIRTAKRGLRAAQKADDEFAVEEISMALEQLEAAKDDVGANDKGGADQPAAGLSAEQQARLEELRRKREAGEI